MCAVPAASSGKIMPPPDREIKRRWAAADYRTDEEKEAVDDLPKMTQKEMRARAKMDRLLAKVGDGKKLTAAEMEWLNEHRALQQAGVTGKEPEFAKSKIDLAAQMGIDRKTLNKYLESPNFPKRTTRGWPIAECKIWYGKLKAGQATSQGAGRGDPEEMGLQKGASHALSRLEAMEVQAGADFMKAYEANDPESIKLTMDTWLALAKQLHAFERIIDKDKRDSGEVMNRSEVEAFLTMIGQAFGYAEEAFLDRFAMLVTELRDPRDAREIRQKSKRLFYEKVSESCDAACADKKFPLWLAEAVAEGMRPGVVQSAQH